MPGLTSASITRVSIVSLQMPFRASEEDLDTVAADLARLPRSLAWPAAWTVNMFA